MEKWLENVIKYGTLLIVFLTPLLYFGGNFFIPYVTSKTFVFYGLVEIIFSFWLYLALQDKKYWLSKKILSFLSPLFFLITWLTFTGIFGINQEISFWSSLGRGTGLLTLYHCLALTVVLISIIRLRGIIYIKSLLMWFLNSSLIVALSVWLGNEGLNLPFEFLQKSKGGGLIGNSSLAASYLLFSIFLGLFLLSINKVVRWQKIWIGSIVALTIFSPLFLNIYSLITKGTIFISARGALLGILIGFFVAIMSHFVLSDRKIIRYSGLVSLLIGFIFIISGWVGLENPDSIIHKKFAESASSSRFIFWDIAKRGMSEKPILGWGPENYSVVYQKYFNPEILKQSSTTAEIWVDRAHNVFYEIGVAGGYPAVILYSVFLLSLIFAVYQSFNLNKINRLQAGIFWGLIIGYVIQNLFVFDSVSSYLGLFVLASIIYALCDNSNIENQNTKNIKGSWFILCNCILIVLLFVMFFYFVILPIKKITKISEVFTLSLNKRFEQYNNLLNISPVGDGWEIGKLAEDTYNLYSNNLEKIKSDPQIFSYSRKDLESFLGYLYIVSQNEPYDYRLYLNMMRLSNIYVKLYDQGNQELISRISESGRRARELSPNHFNLIYLIK